MRSVIKSAKGAWTEEEDQLLAHWQSQYGNKWAEVAKHIPNKTGQQCAQRWRHRVNPNISREKWTDAEDRRLAALVERHGNCWAEIARRLPGRTDQQCMGRWRRHVDPGLRREGWDLEDDEMLMELVEEYGSAWNEICKFLGGRSAHQCRLRWCQLSGAEPQQVQQPQHSRGSIRSMKSCSRSAGGLASSASTEQQLPAKQLDYSDAAGNSSHGHAAGSSRDTAPPLSFLSPPTSRRPRSTSSRAAARRLSTLSEVGMTEQLGEEDSPPFTLRRTTARTAGMAGTACTGAQPTAASPAAGQPPNPLPPSHWDGTAQAAAHPGEHGCLSDEVLTGASRRQSDPAQSPGAVDPTPEPLSPLCEDASITTIITPPYPRGTSASGGGGGGSRGAAALSEAGAGGERQGAAAKAAASSCKAVSRARRGVCPASSHLPTAGELGTCTSQQHRPALGLPAPLSRGSHADGAGAVLNGSPSRQELRRLEGVPAEAVERSGNFSIATAALFKGPGRSRGRGRPRQRPPSLQLPSSAVLGGGDRTPQVFPLEEDEDSPALTHGMGPTLDLLSPSRTITHPPTYTPPSSIRKRPLPPSRIAAFGPRPPPLAIPELADPPRLNHPAHSRRAQSSEGAAEAPEGALFFGEKEQHAACLGESTPCRPSCGRGRDGAEGGGSPGGDWGLTPTLLTMLQSPQAPSCRSLDPLVSPQFGALLTPDWAKTDSTFLQAAGGFSGGASSGSSGRRRASSALWRQGVEGNGPATSLDFTMLGTSPKKAKTSTAAVPPMAVPAATPSWVSLAATAAAAGVPAATVTHLLFPESQGRTALAAALQRGLGLESTAKSGAAPQGSHATLTSMKGARGGEGCHAAGASPPRPQRRVGSPPLTAANVRVQLRTLLENL